MPLVIRDLGAVPTGGWMYPSIDGKMLCYSYSILYDKIVEHYTANNAPIPTRQEVTDWQCKELSLSCYDSDTHEPLINKWVMGISSRPPAGCCGK